MQDDHHNGQGSQPGGEPAKGANSEESERRQPPALPARARGSGSGQGKLAGSGNLAAMAGGLWRSPSAKFFTIGFLILLMLIPLGLVRDLVDEREERAEEVRGDITAGWGSSEAIRGPVLVVPYVVLKTDKSGYGLDKKEERRLAAFLPEALDVSGTTKTNRLQRSIFATSAFRADLALAGRFGELDVAAFDADVLRVDWAEATVVLGLSQLSSLKDAVLLRMDDGVTANFEPGTGLAAEGAGAGPSGIHARPFAATDGQVAGQGGAAAAKRAGFGFGIALGFTGADRLTLAPAGRSTTVALSSDWPHPSFVGAFLPEKRSVSAEGFAAEWRVPHLARDVPQVFDACCGVFQRFEGSDFGVSLIVPVDTYSLVDRALKYGILFIATAFGAAFFLELAAGTRVHAVQYVFVGTAMVLFYVMLLSMSEHAGFAVAYGTAAGMTGTMLSVYSGKVLKGVRYGLQMALVYTLLYGLLYLILRMEDYALLAGSLAAFAVLTVVMFATLRVDWAAKAAALSSPDATGIPGAAAAGQAG